MAAEHFFKRWARPKPPPDGGELAITANPALSPVQNAAVAAEEPPASGAHALPTLDDVVGLNQDSDYSPFLAQGVDEAVKRAAMKKLFANPHFNVMDGLDTYIADYGKADPMPPGMLAALNHAKGLLDPLAQLAEPCAQLSSSLPAPASLPAGATVAADENEAVPAVTTDTSEAPDPPGPASSSNASADEASPSTFSVSPDHAEVTPKGTA